MKKPKQRAANFDLLGNEIFENDLLEIVFLEDFEEGLISTEIVRVAVNENGALEIVDDYGNHLDLSFFPHVFKAA